MTDNSIRPAIEELERFYTFVVAKYKLGLPNECVITIQSVGAKSASGWFAEKFWETKEGKELNEINVSAEHLSKGDPYEILAHEVAHFINCVEGVKGCNTSQYHNKEFARAARLVGLVPEKLKGKGYAITNPSDGFTKAVDEEFKPNKQVFELFRNPKRKVVPPSRMKKYSCGCTVVRCATDLDATCVKCSNKFHIDDD